MLPTPFHGQSLEIVKVSGGRSSSRSNLHVGYESFLKKTMSEKSLITKYAFVNKLYLTCGNANFQEFL